jgi:prolyl-tRNA synthetase
MKMSRYFLHTLREAPADAETAGHQLLLRAACIDQLMAGVYTYQPLGWRVKRKVEQVVREEMDRAGGLEVHMPALQPLEIWEQSGRADAMGSTLFRLADQRDRALALGPTHEEVVTKLFADHSRSYRDLPVTLYQIQTKFRDEARPRGGLVRVREFTMKDAYSFDLDEAGLDSSYDAMFEAYKRIFARCGVPTIAVEADSGAIGGKDSREFMFVTEIGEDTIVRCDRCDYAANTEKAEFRRVPAADEAAQAIEDVATPDTKTIEALATLLGIPAAKTAKAVLYMAIDPYDESVEALPVFVVVRGDHQVNEIKVKNHIKGGRALRPMTDIEARAYGIVPGYASAIGVDARVRVIADVAVTQAPNLVAGANREGMHLRNVNYGRDWHTADGDVIDCATAQAGDGCPRCEGTLGTVRGIEMGHVFRLGTIYSETFGAKVLDEAGEQRTAIMGCYGIGLDRIVSAAVEVNHDERGIMWPASIAPFDVHMVGIGLGRDADLAADAQALYAELQSAGIDVLYDDRDESPGVKFNDADLVGIPLRITVSSRNAKAGVVEVQPRGATEATQVARGEVVAHLLATRDALLAALR